MKKYDYFWAQAAVNIFGIVFITQLILELSGAIVRKPGYEWVVPVCGVIWLCSIAYALILIVLNAIISNAKEKP